LIVARKADTAILRQLLIFVALPLAYLISGRLGLLLAVPPGYATAIFLPAGIAVTATFLAGAITLAPIFVGSFLLNIWIGYSIADQLGYSGFASAFIIAIASTVQAAIGGTVLRRFIGYPALLDMPKDLIFFLTLSPAVCLTSATISIAGLWALGVVKSADLLSNWLSWWAGDTLVVQSGGFRDGMWLDANGSPLTEAGKITERFHRANYGTLDIAITVDDPKAYTKPWTVRIDQRIAPDQEMIEFICNENQQFRRRIKID
jgi:hypothetical protein